MTRISDHRLKWVAFASSMLVYIVVGYWLQVDNGFILGDALSRVSAAQSVLFSRDPHLAAIGFIFTPLTAMLQIPAVLLSPLWPDLTARAFAGSVMSAVFMAGCVVQVLSMGTDRKLPRAYIIAITVLFALNPMIVFYGSNGMSEAPFLFFITWAVRRLTMWMIDDDVHHLIAAGGVAMALSYLTRYDAVACIAAAGVIVGVTTYRRARKGPRLRRALLDLLLVSGPGLASFFGWAVASWLITGEPFAQFTSQYGNAAILQQSGTPTVDFGGGVLFGLTCVMLLAPTLIPLAVWAGVLRLRRPYWPTLIVPLALYGGVLAFQVYSYASGSTFPFLRFYIAAIPFAACLAMMAVPERGFARFKRPGRYAPPMPAQPPKHRGWVAYAPVALVFAVTVPVSAWGMSLPKYAPQEYALAAVLAPDPGDVTERGAVERRVAATFSTERDIARYLDGLDLPESSVITDTVYGFAVVAASKRPKTFVVPSDPDFTELLNDPVSLGVEYLLAVPPTGRGVSDALNVRYPTLYDTGADIATLELEIPNDGDSQPTWRLYRVNEPAPES
ncbi:ABC transporter [Mycolicibacterium flavescens]|uniref:ABC transporter n=1 Tax=Mycolicibacterium flavescens TaxID=1776 RepID=A0A1E3RLH3_MYCFV|nr:ABC transporter [Mycolicibacterium flavescens]MCV7281907.1 ABC transporter [Mycolicibacterium flavescens]ODQ90721.1 ABC transporter [Mycolicibacterium flavescens]